MQKVVGIDLFCGIGGLTNGLSKAGIEIKAGYDIDKTCEKSFSQKCNGNPEFICGDIKEFGPNEFLRHFNNLGKNAYKLVAGCAPCQPYSSYQKNKSVESRSHHKEYGLILEYLRVVDIVKPDFVIMENVRNLINDPVFKNTFLKYFNENNYWVDYKIVNMADYGAPQQRKRLLFLAVSKNVKNFKDYKIKSTNSNDKKTVFDAISDLPKLKAGEVNNEDFMHQASKLSDLNLKRIEHSKEGGTWKDWPKGLLPECYKRQSGRTFTSVYGRLSRNKVAPTLTTQFNRYGSGRFGHYEQNRALSLREGALLQTFPWNYKFDDSLGSTILARQIGNAVPPVFSEVIGKMIIKNINKK